MRSRGRSKREAWLNPVERIDDGQPEPLEIANVAAHHRQIMDERGGGDHRVLDQIPGTPVHEPRPLAENSPIHWKNVIGVCYAIEPDLNGFGPRWILAARHFYAGLQFSERD